MELDDFFLLLRKAEMHETVDSEKDLTVGGVATSPSGGRRKKKKNICTYRIRNDLELHLCQSSWVQELCRVVFQKTTVFISFFARTVPFVLLFG